MRKAIEDYVRKCDLCQRRKGTRDIGSVRHVVTEEIFQNANFVINKLLYSVSFRKGKCGG